MIQLQKGTLNTVYLTLMEKMSSASNYTLIRLTCQATSKAILLLPRSRAHDARKDTLTIREGSADAPAVGDIMLNTPQFPEGFYDYTIWEQTSASNLDPADSSVIGIIEEGMSYIRDTSTAYQESTYTAYNPTQTDYVYAKD
tara:strand:+ start:1536 stop:1961 length:426 start_codon:yes stop_codon:yes gene_type:complete